MKRLWIIILVWLVLGRTSSDAADVYRLNRSGIFTGSENIFISQTGISGTAVVRIDNMSLTQEDMDGYFDSYFYKHNHFIFGRKGNRLYFNYFAGNTWAAYIDSPVDFILQPGKTYHLAFTAKTHSVPESGELWTDIVIYVNGAVIRHYRGYNQAPQNNTHPVQAGKADGFGTGWDYRGNTFEAVLYPWVLSDADIRAMVMADQRITPAFEVLPEIPTAKQMQLAQLRRFALAQSEPVRSRILAAIDCVEYLLLSGYETEAERIITGLDRFDFSGEEKNSIGVLELFDNGNSILCFVNIAGEKYHPAVWFDRNTGRDVFDGAKNEIFRIFLQKDSRTAVVTGRSSDVTSRLTNFTRDEYGRFVFDIRYEQRNVLADVTIILENSRLACRIGVCGRTPEIKLQKVHFPSWRLSNFEDLPSSVLLVPRMSGMAVPDAVNSRFNYSAYYPSGFASMQFGAWYDKNGGVYFAVEDPIASSKMLSFVTSPESLSVDYIWPSVSQNEQGIWQFAPEAPAILELFRGDWFDAGNIYRRFIENEALWGQGTSGRIPEWLRENSLWLSLIYDDRSLEQIDKLLEYFGMPFTIHYYGWCGKFDRDYPQHRGDPESFTVFQELKRRGIRVVPYTNGRLWELRDRRDEDFEYSRYGEPCAVKDPAGKVVTEGYRNVPFAVMCPAAPVWQNKVADFVCRILNYGVDGVYLDQIAASRFLLCYDSSHPHSPGALDAWYNNGYRPMLLDIRQRMSSEHPDAILASEDAAEPYVGLCDALLPWRYMAHNYVPLFQHCYWSKVQLFGRAGGGDEKLAWNFKIANQLVNNEQLGWMSVESLCRPNRTATRRFLKSAMYVRRSLTDYFFSGTMGRPVDFRNLRRMPLHCGVNNLCISVPLIESGVIRVDNREFFIFVNPGTEPQQAEVVYDHLHRNMSDSQKIVMQFSNMRADEVADYAADFSRMIQLAPLEIQIWIIGDIDDEILPVDAQILSEAATLWRSFSTDKDPFSE